MKHCILAKFTPGGQGAARRAAAAYPGDILRRGGYSRVHGAEVIPNCVDRDNRYDVLIRLDMDREALPLYDVSAMHHRWKDEFYAPAGEEGHL